MAQEKPLLQWNFCKTLTLKYQAESVATRDDCHLLVHKENTPDKIQGVDDNKRQSLCSMQVTKKDWANKYPVLENVHRESNNVNNVKKPPVSTDTKRGRPRLDGSMSCTYPVRFKPYVFMILLSSHLSDAMNIHSPTENDQSLSKIQTFELLSITSCKSLNLSMTCPYQGSDELQVIIDFCEFNKMCSSGYTPLCLNNEKGMTFICAPVHLRCEKGHWWRVRKDEEDPSKVKIIVEKCPTGYFQETHSNCINACKSKHLDLTNIEEKYLIYSVGNHINATKVYCNYNKGYYNRAGKFELDYDRESEHEPYFCSGNAEESNPCVEGQKPLPNGTCVLPCNTNECRDDHNNFICKQTCRDQIEDGHSITVTVTDNLDLDTDVAECDEEPWVCENGICKQSLNEHVCQCNPGFVNDGETGRCIGSDVTPQTEPLATGIIFVLFICVIFVCLMTIITVFCTKTKCKPQGELEDGNSSQHDNSSSDTDLQILDGTEDGNSSQRDNSSADTESQRNKDTLGVTREKETELDHELTKPLLDKRPDTDDQDCLEAFESPSNTSKTCLQGGELKKEVDDTFTQSAMANLIISLMSCGALINDGNLKGTVFRVGSKYVMTAYHVIKDIKHLIEAACGDIFVNFEESVCNVSCETYRVNIEFYSEEADIAILALHVANLEKLQKPLLLWPKNVDFLEIRNISVIGYGHADCPYKKHLEKCQILTDPLTEKRVTAAKDFLQKKKDEFIQDIISNRKDYTSVEREYAEYNNSNIIKFDCYMAKGLSGGPILTNEHETPRVIGMVIGMRPELFYNLSPNKQTSFPKEFMFEFGVKMHIVYEQLRSVNPALAQDIFST